MIRTIGCLKENGIQHVENVDPCGKRGDVSLDNPHRFAARGATMRRMAYDVDSDPEVIAARAKAAESLEAAKAYHNDVFFPALSTTPLPPGATTSEVSIGNRAMHEEMARLDAVHATDLAELGKLIKRKYPRSE
jgi:hypothetical protein